jgi:beta-glucosidase
MDTIIGDRTLHELYLLPFEMMVKDAALASTMCSYPRIGGVFSCENAALLTDVLRDGGSRAM